MLQRLAIKFDCIAPDIDESPMRDESAMELSLRLAREKALKVANNHYPALIIASDQVLVNGNVLLGKPRGFARAKQQLLSVQGKAVTFYTSVCLLNTETSKLQIDALPIHVHFRQLSELEIERYLAIEKPYDCAGSFKSESLGISLLTGIDCDDPTALIGLPLIRLCEMLRSENVELP